MVSSTDYVQDLSPHTVFSGAVLVDIVSVLSLSFLWSRHKRDTKSARSRGKRDGLNAPLLPVNGDGAEGSQSYSVKCSAALWTRQFLCFVEAALHCTLAVYTLSTRKPPPLEGLWQESATAHLLFTLAWTLAIWAEERAYRKLKKPRLPWSLGVYYNLCLVASGFYVAQACTESGVGFAVRLAGAWNALVLLLLAIAGLWGCTHDVHVYVYDTEPTPEQRANLLSYLTFYWFQPVIIRGLRKRLDADDLPPLIQEDLSSSVWGVFSRLLGKLGQPRKVSEESLRGARKLADDERESMEAKDEGRRRESDAELLVPKGKVEEEKPKEEKKERRNGWKISVVLFRLGGWDVILTAIWQLVGCLAVFIAPLALQQVVDFVTNYTHKQAIPIRVLLCTAGLLLGPSIQAFADGQNFFIVRRLIVKYRAALIDLIFRKALRLDMSCSTYSVGELVNLCSVDANSVEALSYIHFAWSTLLQIIVCCVLIFNVLGVSALAGLGFMIISMPITAYASKKVQSYQHTMMEKKDARMSIVSEVLNGIRIIKMFAWERDFLKKIREARKEEVSYLRRFIYCRMVVIVAWDATPTLVALFTFLVHTLVLKRTLTASTGYAALALFDLLRFPLVVLPDFMNYVVKALVSFGRIEAFLERDEVAEGARLTSPSSSPHTFLTDGSVKGTPSPQSSNNGYTSPPSTNGYKADGSSTHGANTMVRPMSPVETGSVRIVNGTFRWGAIDQSGRSTLHDINLHIKPGDLVCIYGPTGCGKTSLLAAMLGEIRKLEGCVRLNGRVAYVAQKAWVRNATLRANILFGKPYDEDKYHTTIDTCALTRDLEILEGNDLTEIGEKGVNLSGGQQQRINLARAVYQALMNAADVLVMDDVLSAVDAHVGEHIFHECICGVLQNKTRVLVTHQVALTLPQADYVIIMGRDGTIVEQGSRAELQDRAADLLKRYGVISEDSDEDTEIEGEEAVDATKKTRRSREGQTGKRAENKENKGKELIKEEEREEGSLKLRVYWAYFMAMGGLIVTLIVCGLFGAVEGLRYLQTQALGTWVDNIAEGASAISSSWPYIYMSVSASVIIFLRAWVMAWASLRASLTVHSNMAERVMWAPCSWFEKTPVGRILNRFSSDIETLDKNLMDSLGSFVECLLNTIAVVIVVAWHTPPLLVGMLPMLSVAFLVAYMYLKSSRELKRLESNTRSPIYSHFSETVTGVSTVRAYGVQDQFIRESHSAVDLYGRVNFYLWAANRWLGVRLQLLGASITGMVGVYILVMLPIGGKLALSGSQAGLTLLYAMNFSSAINWLIRNQAELEMNMNSMERAEEYCKVEQEAPAVIESYRPPAKWPEQGEISVKNLTIRYASATNPVIHDMTFHIPPGTRVGVVGRTGAGKSSLLAALYRLVEPEHGSIVIDGYDLRRMGLQDLRSRLSIVPQDPTLFRGTARNNTDPFEEYTDDQIWDALRRAHLCERLQRKGSALQLEITENGGNLSVGERQLLCMARALLRRRAVLVMDEATANVDPETDTLIQETLKSEFGGCTVLTVAHRLATVVYYDRVMVLDHGRIVEYDAPFQLLQNTDGVFYQMCEKTGNLDGLVEMAKEAYERHDATRQPDM